MPKVRWQLIKEHGSSQNMTKMDLPRTSLPRAKVVLQGLLYFRGNSARQIHLIIMLKYMSTNNFLKPDELSLFRMKDSDMLCCMV